MIGVSLEIWNVALKVGVISETILQGKCVISVPRRKKAMCTLDIFGPKSFWQTNCAPVFSIFSWGETKIEEILRNICLLVKEVD